MNVREYVKGALPEAVVFAAASGSLGYLFSTAFNAGEGLAAVPLAAVTAAVLTAVLYVISYNKRMALLGGVALAVVLAACLGVALVLGDGANVLVDTEGNLVLFEAVVVLTCIGAFLLSRKRALCIALVVLGVFAYGVIQYLYLEGHVAAFLVFLVSGMVLLMYRTYRLGLAGSATRRTSFLPVLASTLVVACLSVLVGAGVYYLIVQPLDPPAQEIKLITEYRALEELPRRGVNEELSITDPDMTSTVLNGEYAEAQTDDNSDLETETNPSVGTLSDAIQSAMQTIGSAVGLDDEGTSLWDLITFNRHNWWKWLLAVLAIVLVVASPFVIKLVRRKRFLEKALALPPRECVETLYLRFMRDFKRLGVARGAQATPYEFAYETSSQLRGFAENDRKADFTSLTVTFVESSFGEKEPSPYDVEDYKAFYESFFKNSRKLVGTPRYLRLFFRL